MIPVVIPESSPSMPATLPSMAVELPPSMPEVNPVVIPDVIPKSSPSIPATMHSMAVELPPSMPEINPDMIPELNTDIDPSKYMNSPMERPPENQEIVNQEQPIENEGLLQWKQAYYERIVVLHDIIENLPLEGREEIENYYNNIVAWYENEFDYAPIDAIMEIIESVDGYLSNFNN